MQPQEESPTLKKKKIERSASAALEVEVDGNVTVPLCVAFEVVIEFFSLLSEASEPITKLLGNFFVVEIFHSKDILVSDQVWLGVSVSL